MKDYIFCGVVDVAAILCIAWLGYLVWNGATNWLIIVMLLLIIGNIVPGTEIFTCPECGKVTKVKTFRLKFNEPVCLTKENKQE